jgi:hypothetical protein
MHYIRSSAYFPYNKKQKVTETMYLIGEVNHTIIIFTRM